MFWGVLLIATYQLSLFRQRIKHLTDKIVLFIIMSLNYFFYNAEPNIISAMISTSLFDMRHILLF